MTDIIWQILGVITIALLILFWRTKNAVFGGFTLGVVIGLILSIFTQSGFNLIFIAKGSIVGTMLGFGAELLGKFSDLLNKKYKAK